VNPSPTTADSNNPITQNTLNTRTTTKTNNNKPTTHRGCAREPSHTALIELECSHNQRPQRPLTETRPRRKLPTSSPTLPFVYDASPPSHTPPPCACVWPTAAGIAVCTSLGHLSSYLRSSATRLDTTENKINQSDLAVEVVRVACAHSRGLPSLDGEITMRV
jgi:hypothetical protein